MARHDILHLDEFQGPAAQHLLTRSMYWPLRTLFDLVVLGIKEEVKFIDLGQKFLPKMKFKEFLTRSKFVNASNMFSKTHALLQSVVTEYFLLSSTFTCSTIFLRHNSCLASDSHFTGNFAAYFLTFFGSIHVDRTRCQAPRWIRCTAWTIPAFLATVARREQQPRHTAWQNVCPKCWNEFQFCLFVCLFVCFWPESGLGTRVKQTHQKTMGNVKWRRSCEKEKNYYATVKENDLKLRVPNWRQEKRPCHSPCFGTRAGSWQFKHLTGRRTLLGKTLNEMDLLTLWMPHDAATFMLQHSHSSICHQKHFQTKGRIRPGLEGRFYDEIILLFCCKAGLLLLQIVWIQRPGRNAGGWIWAMHDGFCFRNDNNSETLMKTTWKKWAWLENGPSVQHRHPQNIDDSFQMPNQNKHEHTEW